MRKILSLFAFVAIVISFAACGGNEPEIKDFTFKVYVLNTRAHITVTPLDNEKLYYWNYVRADELNGQTTLQDYVQAYCSIFTSYTTSKGEEKEYAIFSAPDTKYILWACYVEELEGGQLKIIGDIVSQEITSKGQHFLENVFSFGPNKPAFFSNCNYIKGEYYDYPQWIYYGRTSSTADMLNSQDLFTWTEMDQASFYGSVPGQEDWWYLFRERDHADERFTLATIRVDKSWMDEPKDIHGLIILPDDWQTPDNVTLKTAKDIGLVWKKENFAYEAASSSFNGYAENVFNNTTEWWALEEAGAVFLPAAGANAGSVNSSGFYWSSSESEDDNTKAFGFMFNKYRLSLDRLIYPLDKTQYSYSVRPVD